MPTVIDRMINILRANINDALDEAENPEATLNQIIRDMQDALRQADSDIAEQIAEQKMIESDLQSARQNATAWREKAQLAVSKNADALARQALARANDYEDQVQVYQKQLDAQTHAVSELKAKRDQLQSKYESAVRNREMLVSRAKRAQAQQRMTRTTTKVSSFNWGSELDRMERRIKQMEARSDAEAEVADDHSSLEDQFDRLGDDQRVEQQLAELKATMGQER